MAFLGPNNSIAWAHFRLRGGWRRSLTFSIGAAIILWAVIFSGTRFDPKGTARLMSSWTTGLLGIQAGLLVLYVTGRVSAAVRLDITGKMIESHRIMPNGALEAIAGYISGAACQPLVLCGAIFLVGAWTNASAGMELSRWAILHCVLLFFAAFVWTVAAYASFAARLGPAVLILPFFLGPMVADGGPISAVPGVAVLLNPIIGQSIFDPRSGGINALGLPPTYAIAIAAQCYFGVIFFIAAARRYRTVDGIGIGPLLGLLLVAGWVGVTCIGLRSWQDYQPHGYRWMDTRPEIKIITSMIAGMLIALTPIAAAAWARRRWWLHRAAGDSAPMGRPMPAMLVIAIATLLITLIACIEGSQAPKPQDVMRTILIIAMALASIYFLCAWVYFGYDRAGVAILLWVVLAWGAPIVIDLVRYGLADYGETEQIDGIASCSPIGALIVILDHRHVGVTPGIAMQALIAAIPFALWGMVVVRRRTHAADAYKALPSP